MSKRVMIFAVLTAFFLGVGLNHALADNRLFRVNDSVSTYVVSSQEALVDYQSLYNVTQTVYKDYATCVASK